MNANETAINDLISDVFNEAPISITYMDFGHNSQTYDVALKDRSVIVRTNANADVFKGTAHNLTVLGGLDLPVSRVLAEDHSKTRYPFAYMIVDKIPGRDLRYELATMSQAQMSRLAAQIVGFQQRVATLPEGVSFGYVPIGERGRFGSWWELVQHEVHMADAYDVPALATWIGRLKATAERIQGYFAQVRPTCFLDDVTVKNVIVQNGELQGLVDFDCVCYGDPLFMVALTATGVVSDVGTRELFYVDELCRCWQLTDQQKRIMALYAALFAANFVQRAGTHASAAWLARMFGALEKWTRLAESE